MRGLRWAGKNLGIQAQRLFFWKSPRQQNLRHKSSVLYLTPVSRSVLRLPKLTQSRPWPADRSSHLGVV
jgi:hypothetical protein